MLGVDVLRHGLAPLMLYKLFPSFLRRPTIADNECRQAKKNEQVSLKLVKVFRKQLHRVDGREKSSVHKQPSL